MYFHELQAPDNSVNGYKKAWCSFCAYSLRWGSGKPEMQKQTSRTPTPNMIIFVHGRTDPSYTPQAFIAILVFWYSGLKITDSRPTKTSANKRFCQKISMEPQCPARAASACLISVLRAPHPQSTFGFGGKSTTFF
ncbi:MAG: hypothetical protein ACI4BD_01255 [Paludibacteraceae bacterium]